MFSLLSFVDCVEAFHYSENRTIKLIQMKLSVALQAVSHMVTPPKVWLSMPGTFLSAAAVLTKKQTLGLCYSTLVQLRLPRKKNNPTEIFYASFHSKT